jgi:aryl-alcohol dehydrogenase-like predicted oxidoreductase
MVTHILLGDELKTPSIGFGTLSLSGGYGPITEQDATAVLKYAIDRGAGFFDTADAYGVGGVERLLGRAIAGRRGQVQIATKVGRGGGGSGGVRNDASYLRSAVEASLRRLGVDRIDLLYLHRLDTAVPLEDTVGIMAEFVAKGSVGHLGLSEVTASELERAVVVHPIAAVQGEWSVWSRDVERQVVPAAARLGVGFVASSPLGRGFLAGLTTVPANRDQRARVPRLVGKNRQENLSIAHELARIADEEKITPAQLALAWLSEAGRRAGISVVPVPGARTAAHLDDNLASTSVTLASSTVASLDQLAARTSGERGNLQWLSVGRE